MCLIRRVHDPAVRSAALHLDQAAPRRICCMTPLISCLAAPSRKSPAISIFPLIPSPRNKPRLEPCSCLRWFKSSFVPRGPQGEPAAWTPNLLAVSDEVTRGEDPPPSGRILSPSPSARRRGVLTAACPLAPAASRSWPPLASRAGMSGSCGARCRRSRSPARRAALRRPAPSGRGRVSADSLPSEQTAP